jgi:hypothetical protein
MAEVLVSQMPPASPRQARAQPHQQQQRHRRQQQRGQRRFPAFQPELQQQVIRHGVKSLVIGARRTATIVLEPAAGADRMPAGQWRAVG